MEKEFCTYKQALALKELGFDEPCMAWYDIRKPDVSLNTSHYHSGKWNYLENAVSLPLYQQAFRWFREKYGLFGTVDKKDGIRFYKVVDENENLMGVDTSFKTYEEAEQACLNKLIEICKTKTNG